MSYGFLKQMKYTKSKNVIQWIGVREGIYRVWRKEHKDIKYMSFAILQKPIWNIPVMALSIFSSFVVVVLVVALQNQVIFGTSILGTAYE